MADICLCIDNTCPQKDKCRRFLTKPEILDTYFSESPRKGEDCDYFMNVRMATTIGKKKPTLAILPHIEDTHTL